MAYDYTRKFFCIVRWILYLIGASFIAAGDGWFGTAVIGFAFVLTEIDVRWEQSLARRYKWYGIAWISYYFLIMIFVIVVKGKVFNFPGFGLLFIVPFIPEVVIFEVIEFRRK
jgi:hypothetical protein